MRIDPAAMAAPPAEVIVDDRLATVLATVPASAAGARTQYRQLLDLLGRTPPDFALPAAAHERLAALEAELEPSERAALIRALGGSLRHPALMLRLAGQEPAVAAAAIAAARLDDWQWSALAVELPPATRGHLRQRGDFGPRTRAVLERLGVLDVGLPAPERDAVDEPGAEAAGDAAEGIGAIVRRIEAFRRSRQRGAASAGGVTPAQLEAAPRLPLGEFGRESAPPPSAIGFVSDAAGAIVSADHPYAAMLAGYRLGASAGDAPARSDRATARALAEHRPVRDGRLTLAGAELIAGAWRFDATPRFAPDSGRFLGYRGILRRPEPGTADPAVEGAADRLRQLLHELRTPVNAIQGFAELIQQQLFGPTPHQYRGLAAAIAADSAGVLAGFDELERLVRLETESHEAHAGSCDLAAVLARLLNQVRPALTARGAQFDYAAVNPAPAAIVGAQAEQLLWRIVGFVAGEMAPAEQLGIELAASGQTLRFRVALPASVAGDDPSRLFALARPAGDSAPGAALLGSGFGLRLARAEARAAGGDLHVEDGYLVLDLPGLTASADAHSSAAVPAAGRAGGHQR